jgi:hypothetical protein
MATLELRSEAASSLKLRGFHTRTFANCTLKHDSTKAPRSFAYAGSCVSWVTGGPAHLAIGQFLPDARNWGKRQIAIVAVRANNLHSQNVIHDGLASTTSFYFSTLQGLAPAMLAS